MVKSRRVSFHNGAKCQRALPVGLSSEEPVPRAGAAKPRRDLGNPREFSAANAGNSHSAFIHSLAFPQQQAALLLPSLLGCRAGIRKS